MTLLNSEHSGNFFIAGGTLRYDAPSYVHRTADDDLLSAILNGKLCYILTPRQMGKSSLMVRTSSRLQQEGYQTVIIDLTAIGVQVTPEQWYFSLIDTIDDQLKVCEDISTWWHTNEMVSPVGRFVRYIDEFLLADNNKPVVIFIDEIDTTLSIDFTDDFFAAIRSIFNKRATTSEYNRLTFVLLGVASPSDLVKDEKRTPFNVGQEILLNEFTRKDSRILQDALPGDSPSQKAELFNRIYFWTSGHPYLTQKICEVVSQNNDHTIDTASVDAIVKKVFLVNDSLKESNVQFVHSFILRYPERTKILQTYKKIIDGKSVSDNPQSNVQNHLKLAGLVKVKENKLIVRNHLYQTVFNHNWIKENSLTRKTTAVGKFILAMTLIILLLLGLLFISSVLNNLISPSASYYSTGTLNHTAAQVGVFALGWTIFIAGSAITVAGVGVSVWHIWGREPAFEDYFGRFTFTLLGFFVMWVLMFLWFLFTFIEASSDPPTTIFFFLGIFTCGMPALLLLVIIWRVLKK